MQGVRWVRQSGSTGGNANYAIQVSARSAEEAACASAGGFAISVMSVHVERQV